MNYHKIPYPIMYIDIAKRSANPKEKLRQYVEAYVERQGMDVLKIKQGYAICTKRDEGGGAPPTNEKG